MRHHNLELDMLLRGIVMTRGENGATINEMRSDYYQIYGQQWPLQHDSTHDIVGYLMEIDGLLMNREENGLCIWYIDDIGIPFEVSSNDINNNVITIDTTASTQSEKQQPVHNNSYDLPAPRRRMVTSSFVRERAQEDSSSSSTSTLLMESIENGNPKRNLSQLSQVDQTMDKRPRVVSSNGLPLNEENLDIHNRENGVDGMVTQTTSTEIEKSISIPSDLIDGCIAVNDYIAPIKKAEGQQLQHAFKRCQINSKHNFMHVDSAESTISMDEHLFSPGITVIGDDFFRCMMSFELFGADFTDKDDDRFEYCKSGQTVREAYHMLLDKQNRFREKFRYIIVNVGAIDILLERSFIDIAAEYTRLIKAILTIGLTPIITTIPNLWISSNNRNNKTIYQTLLLFNQYLLHNYRDDYKLLDLHLCFAEPRNYFPTIYYHNQSKIIRKFGKRLELCRWTENGRKKILEKIEEMIQTL